MDGLKRKTGNAQSGVTLQGGVLAIGQLQLSPEWFDFNSGFVGLLSRFNVWDKCIQDAAAIEKMAHACSAEIGNVVPWPEVYLRLKGDYVIRQPSSLCSFPGGSALCYILNKASQFMVYIIVGLSHCVSILALKAGSHVRRKHKHKHKDIHTSEISISTRT